MDILSLAYVLFLVVVSIPVVYITAQLIKLFLEILLIWGDFFLDLLKRGYFMAWFDSFQSFFLKFINSPIKILYAILGLVIIGFFTPEGATIGLTALLVAITFLYTLFTKDILEDGKIKSDIELKQRQLEYFYHPLIQLINEAEYGTQRNVDKKRIFYHDIIIEIVIHSGDVFKNLYKYQYLASDNIRDYLLKLEFLKLEYCRNGRIDVNETNTNTIDNFANFKNDIELEIENITSELFDLYNKVGKFNKEERNEPRVQERELE